MVDPDLYEIVTGVKSDVVPATGALAKCSFGMWFSRWVRLHGIFLLGISLHLLDLVHGSVNGFCGHCFRHLE